MHQAAVDLHEHVVSDPGFAAVDHFSDGVDDMLHFIRRLKQEFMIIKYSDLAKRIRECMILMQLFWEYGIALIVSL